MTKEDSIQCSRCGSSISVDVRYAACGAISRWARNNYPAPNDYFTTYDDIRLWRIGLCETCKPSGYNSFLQNQLREIAKKLAVFSLFLIVGILALYFQIPGQAPNPLMKPLYLFTAAIISIGFAAGVIGVPIYAVRWIVSISRLKGLERSGGVASKRVDEAFVGEGQRIIKALASESGESPVKVWGEFPLPEHKTLNQLNNPPEAKKKLGFSIPGREIEAIGKTIGKMEEQLPSHWKALWEQRKKNQPESGRDGRTGQILQTSKPVEQIKLFSSDSGQKDETESAGISATQKETPEIKQVVNPAPEIICSKCGNAGLPEDRFCRKCGNPLK
jgi:hypothetical protein